MTFLGFQVNKDGDLLNPGTNQVLEQKLVDPTLRGQLQAQGVNFDVNYEERNRLIYLLYNSGVFKNTIYTCF